MVGDGSIGWPEYQPYDAIIVTAAAPAIPKSLKAQLAVGGRMIIPVTDDGIGEDLVRLTRNEAGFVRETLTAVRFVPLIGQEGY
ncbi:protein-L-isoaspartate O-methyltransferase [Ochromonadaceae sp. CCMP2298]|nr:protein-L-isoaspartate O-methyltransferase [Ochromonadaceae sp. CCMP2298]|mmetsp:Transcript_25007/g.54074  ORF Transcript_25007/g.54074 Transcript_25007/m.54074 type:complete len:84 (+) Transcript_25007:311-562(+)